MNNKLLEDPRLSQLSPIAFKAYFYLVKKAGDDGVLKKFSIRGQAKEWDIDQNMNLTNNKITMKKILLELEDKGLIQHKVKERELIIKNIPKNIKTVQVKTLENGDGFIDLEEFKDIVDITKVDSYKLKEVGDKSLSIEFFDKEGNKLKTK